MLTDVKVLNIPEPGMLRAEGIQGGSVDVNAINIARRMDVKLNELAKQILMLLPLLLLMYVLTVILRSEKGGTKHVFYFTAMAHVMTAAVVTVFAMAELRCTVFFGMPLNRNTLCAISVLAQVTKANDLTSN